jgi:hypothetical protein
VLDGDRRWLTRAEYDDEGVTVAFEDGRRMRTRRAELSEAAYENLASLFLWRTLDQSVGTEVRYVNVVIDPKSGTISRALGTVRVQRREEVQLPAGAVQAWRVEFRSAGVTNTAWYRADGARTLVRYEITRGPTLVLESVTGSAGRRDQPAGTQLQEPRREPTAPPTAGTTIIAVSRPSVRLRSPDGIELQ